jgi:nitrite reductase/ring-hydroxylating ferredoxin subunit
MTGDIKYIRACSVSELEERKGLRVTAENGGEAAVFKVKGKIYAVDNVCPHNHTAKMHLGKIKDNDILCPIHLYKFSLRTGKNLNNQTSDLKTYDVKIIDSDVYIEEPKSADFNFSF